MSRFSYINNLSVRSKIWIGFSLVLIVFVLQGIRSVDSLKTVSSKFNQVASEVQPTVLNTASLEARIEAVSSGLGLYLLTKDAYQKRAFSQNLKQVTQIIKTLKSSKAISQNSDAVALIVKIETMVASLIPHRDQLFELTEDDNKNILAIGYANDEVNPLIRDMIQLTSEMLTSEAEEEFQQERLKLLNTIHYLRYNLINLVTEMRLFLAFKSTSALDNVELYRGAVDSAISQLTQLGDDGLLTFEQENAIEQFIELEVTFIKNFSRLVEIHSSDKWRQDAYLIKTEVGPLLAEIKLLIRELVFQQKEITKTTNESIHVLVETQSQQFYYIAAAVILLVILIAWVLSSKITRPLKYSVEIANSIANGFLENKIKVNSQDETGQVLQAMSEMQTRLHENIVKERKFANENARIKEALDNVSANVMMADQNNDIIYINDAALTLFSEIESDLSKAIPGFKANEIVGSNIDSFHKNPAHQQNLVQGLKARHEASFLAGSRSMSFIANPVLSDNGERLGTVVEWKDKTVEIKIEQEIENIMEAVKLGDLNQQIVTAGKTGFMLNLSEGINEMVKEVSDTLSDIDTSMLALSQGNLTRTIQRSYQGAFGSVAENVNETINKLGEIVGEINRASSDVSQSAQEILDGNNSLSSRTEHQASALEQTASSMEEITVTVKQNSENAQIGNNLSTDAGEMADKGGQVVDEAINAMQEINDSSKKIAEIIGVIDEIAFQTNLLALNASVEAARAGEQGRGFAVVATEVRNLAGRSATAAKEIKGLIQDSVEKVSKGTELVNKSGETLKEIVTGVKKVGDIVGEIASASQEQSTGIEQVNAAVTSMDETTQQNAALAEQTSAASVALSERAADMSRHLLFFTQDTNNDIQTKVNDRHESELTTGYVPKPVIKAVENSQHKVSKSFTPTVEMNGSTEGTNDDEWEEF